MSRIELRKKEIEIEIAREWDKWVREIPFIPTKSNWQIRPLPPFSGAVARFEVKDDKNGWCSIYLDCYNNLGSVGEPYWEVYGVETKRILMNDINGLVNAIEESLEELNKIGGNVGYKGII